MEQSPHTDADTYLVTDESPLKRLPIGPQNVLTLLYDRTPDAWLDAWRRERDDIPARHVLVNVCEFTRSTAASRGPDPLAIRGITLDTVEHDPSFETDATAVTEYLTGWGREPGETIVVIDSLAWLLDHESEAIVRAFIEDITKRVRMDNATAYVIAGELTTEGRQAGRVLFEDVEGASTVNPEHEASTVVSQQTTTAAPQQNSEAAVLPQTDGEPVETGQPRDDSSARNGRHSSLRSELRDGIVRLRQENPTNYGYLRRNWTDAKAGIEATNRSYPTASQIHSDLADTESTPRTLGPALKAFETLDVIGVWDETVAANRYDLTKYDEQRAAILGELLEECDG